MGGELRRLLLGVLLPRMLGGRVVLLVTRLGLHMVRQRLRFLLWWLVLRPLFARLLWCMLRLW
jgi:hypothetical protein